MKKSLLLLFVLVCIIITSCGPRYSVKRDKAGIYRTVETEFNILASDNQELGQGVIFNPCKYMYGGKTFYSFKLMYQYPGNAWMEVPIGFNGNGFGIKHDKGVYISVNGGKPYPFQYKTRPEHKIQTIRSTSGQSVSTVSRDHIETVECRVSSKLMKFILNAKNMEVTIYGTEFEGEKIYREKKIVYYMKEENLELMKRFYNEELKELHR